jgi:hypothetical protein
VSSLTIASTDIAKLTNLAAVLIPGTSDMPAVDQLADFASQLQIAVNACGYSEAQIRATLEVLQPGIDWNSAKVFATDRPEEFHIASLLVSAAYFMEPVVLAKLGYPTDRQHPADLDEFATEYESGILDAVTARGSIFRDPSDT